MDVKHDLDDSEALKRKSKSPSFFENSEPKRPKLETEEPERPEDVAKQYKKFVAAPKFNFNSEELFCICRKPDVEGELMISCDSCEEWFHAKCMKIDPELTQLLDKFFCKFCHWKGDGVTKWNRKCRLPGCINPIRKEEKSKYCSDVCGEKFLSSKLSQSDSLTTGDLSFVVNYCGSYADLKSMGSAFPELPEIVSLDFSKLPTEVQKTLSDNDLKQADVRAQHEESQKSGKYLARVKEMIAVINESIQAVAGPVVSEETTSKSKKKKGSKYKKIDLCCFRNDFNKILGASVGEDAVNDTDVREFFKSEIESAISLYQDQNQTNNEICLQERRKCIRHNGWFNLLSDRIWKRSSELQYVLETLEHLKSEALRSYSISVYEGEN